MEKAVFCNRLGTAAKFLVAKNVVVFPKRKGEGIQEGLDPRFDPGVDFGGRRVGHIADEGDKEGRLIDDDAPPSCKAANEGKGAWFDEGFRIS